MRFREDDRGQIAVVIPVKNDELSLTRALESLKGQSSPADEVIVVDDASDPEVRPERLPTVPGLRVLRRERSEGVGPARNMAVREALSDWIAFLDADDEFLPGRVAAVRGFLKSNGGCDALYSDVWVEGRKGRKRLLQRTPEPGPNFLRALLHTPFLSTSSVVVRRSAILAVGGFPPREEASTFEDYALWLRLAKDHRWDKLTKPLVVYHLGKPVWLKRDALLEEWHGDLVKTVLRAAGGDTFLEKLGRSTVAYMTAKRALQEGERGQAWHYWKLAATIYPRRLNLWRFGIVLAVDLLSLGQLRRIPRIRERVFWEYD